MVVAVINLGQPATGQTRVAPKQGHQP